MTRLPNYASLGAGPMVLFLHDAEGGHLTFAPQLETLAAQGYRAVAWDMPGYGHSDPIEPYHFKGLAEKCMALMAALSGAREPRVCLVGHGLGGMVAQEVVARRPDWVSHLVLCATTAASLSHDPGGPLAGLVEGGAAQSMTEQAQAWVGQLAGPQALPEGLRLAEHCMAGVNPGTYRRALQARAGFDRRSMLSKIAAPTLLVSGECDPTVPLAQMQFMQAEILGSRWVVLPGIGHWVNLEAPEEFDRLLLSFLAENHEAVWH